MRFSEEVRNTTQDPARTCKWHARNGWKGENEMLDGGRKRLHSWVEGKVRWREEKRGKSSGEYLGCAKPPNPNQATQPVIKQETKDKMRTGTTEVWGAPGSATHPFVNSWKFGGHVKDKQWYPPWMLKQLSDAEQVWLPAAHSSISENHTERGQG